MLVAMAGDNRMVILFSIIAVALCLNVAVTYQLKRLMSGCAGNNEDLRRIQPVMQEQYI